MLHFASLARFETVKLLISACFSSSGEVLLGTWSLLDLPDSSFLSFIRSCLSSQTFLPLHLLIFLPVGVERALALGEAVLDDQTLPLQAPP